MGDSPPCPEASGNLERSNFRCKYLQPTMLSAFQQILYSNFDVVVDRFGFTRTSQQRECQSNEGPKLIKLYEIADDAIRFETHGLWRFQGQGRRILILVSYLMPFLMCRNIKTLHNFSPPATEEEIRASSLQFVRKLSGFTRPSKANEEIFTRAVDKVTEIARELLSSLVTNAPPRNREIEALKARERSAKRFPPTPVPVAAGHDHV